MTRASNRKVTDMDIKPEFDHGKNNTRSTSGTSNKTFLKWIVYLIGAVGTFALWQAKGTNRIKYTKFATTHILSIGAGVGGTYIAVFLIHPSTYDNCIDAEEQDMFNLYKGW